MKEIKVEQLNFYYGDHHTLKDITMTIQPNQITALIGPSGCGKSTFLKTLNRMHEFQKNTRHTGSIIFEQQNIFDQDPYLLRKRIGMVFQQPNPLRKSIFDNVAYGPKLLGIKNKNELASIVEKALWQVGLWQEVKDKLHQSALGLSGGQQQRLCIARTIAVEPEVILMDEPTSALDPIATSKIEELILELKKQYTIVIVTHNMQQAMRISDMTAFFYLGELVEYALTEQLFANPGQQKTLEYIRGSFS